MKSLLFAFAVIIMDAMGCGRSSSHYHKQLNVYPEKLTLENMKGAYGVISVSFDSRWDTGVTYKGLNGKIVSLDDASLCWDSESLFANKMGCTSTTDGSYNTSYMPSGRSLARAWCTSHGEGWYCPARSELVTLAYNIQTINASLRSAGKDTFSGYYWSSTEYNSAYAYIVTLVPWNTKDRAGDYSYVSKDVSYYVCAVKQF